MRIAIAYPVPNESPEVWAEFKPYVERFVKSVLKFPPGVRAMLFPLTFGPATEELENLFRPL